VRARRSQRDTVDVPSGTVTLLTAFKNVSLLFGRHRDRRTPACGEKLTYITFDKKTVPAPGSCGGMDRKINVQRQRQDLILRASFLRVMQLT